MCCIYRAIECDKTQPGYDGVDSTRKVRKEMASCSSILLDVTSYWGGLGNSGTL